jgi:hypothetical protein
MNQPFRSIKALPSQARAHAQRKRFRGYSGPVGSGKTLWLCDHMLVLAYKNRRRAGLLGAPTYPMLRDASLATLFARMEHYRVPFTYTKSENTILLKEPETRILCRSVENFDRLRGTNLAFFGLDETSYCPELAWLQLEARLRDPLAKERAGLGAWTPRGFDWVYRRFIKDPLPGYEAVLANPMENTYLPTDFYQSLLDSYSANFARQEVLGEYLNVFSGRAYTSFSSEPRGNIWRKDASNSNYRGFAPVLFKRDRPLLWSLDFNVSPGASIIAQTVPLPGYEIAAGQEGPSAPGGLHWQLNVLDELYLMDTTTYAVCEEFYARVKPKLEPGRKMHVRVFGDPAGEQRKSSSTKTDWQIVREFFARHADEFSVTYRVGKGSPTQRDRVNSVNAVSSSATGVRRLAVHERCKELVRDMEQVAWAMDTNHNILTQLSVKDKMRNHISDALGYLIWQEFNLLKQRVGEVRVWAQ